MSRSFKSNQPGRGARRYAGPTSGANPPTKLHTIAQTAQILQTSERTIQRLIGSKQLRAHYLGRLVRIGDADIAALLDLTRTD